MFSICGGSAATVWTGYIHTWRYSYSIVTLQGDPLAEIIFTFIFSYRIFTKEYLGQPKKKKSQAKEKKASPKKEKKQKKN